MDIGLKIIYLSGMVVFSGLVFYRTKPKGFQQWLLFAFACVFWEYSRTVFFVVNDDKICNKKTPALTGKGDST